MNHEPHKPHKQTPTGKHIEQNVRVFRVVRGKKFFTSAALLPVPQTRS
jgi:hypothetical protein